MSSATCSRSFGVVIRRRAVVHLTYDIEYFFIALVWRGLRREQTADSKVSHCSLAFRDERVSRLSDAVMDKRVGSAHTMKETGPDRLPERRVDRRVLSSGNEVYGGDCCDASKTGERSQSFLRRLGQPIHLRGHEICNVGGEALRADPIDIPLPGAPVRVEDKQAVLRQRCDKLIDEKRVASGFLKHQFGERSHVLRFRPQRVGDEPSDVAGRERLERDLLDARPSVADLLQHPDEQMRGVKFVGPVGADQQDVLHVRFCDQVLNDFEGRSIQPLQIVQEQRERTLWPGESAEEAPENHLE